MWCTAQRIGLVVGCGMCAFMVRAEAQEYCVSCLGPDAVYRCVIDGARPGGAQSLQMLCLSTMAKEGGHATCSVKRGTVFECTGPVKRISWAALNELPSHPSWDSSVQQIPQPEAEPADKKAPPKTMVELAKQTNEKTAAQLKKAGEDVTESVKTFGQTIANSTTKTWQCLTSLFSRCGE